MRKLLKISSNYADLLLLRTILTTKPISEQNKDHAYILLIFYFEGSVTPLGKGKSFLLKVSSYRTSNVCKFLGGMEWAFVD
jgi:hypothetical protein